MRKQDFFKLPFHQSNTLHIPQLLVEDFQSIKHSLGH